MHVRDYATVYKHGGHLYLADAEAIRERILVRLDRTPDRDIHIHTVLLYVRHHVHADQRPRKAQESAIVLTI